MCLPAAVQQNACRSAPKDKGGPARACVAQDQCDVSYGYSAAFLGNGGAGSPPDGGKADATERKSSLEHFQAKWAQCNRIMLSCPDPEIRWIEFQVNRHTN
jgi:hypothetical protein